VPLLWATPSESTVKQVDVAELVKIRSLANDNLRLLPNTQLLEPHEFVAYCWVMAINARLQLNIKVELPTRWTTPTETK
jgi:hypothetical protein